MIVLGIIGIVAEATIPGIIVSTQNKEFATSAQKAYSTFQQAILRYKADNGGYVTDLFPESGDSDYSINQLAPYLKVVKKCKTTEVCWTEKTKYLNAINDGSGTFSTHEQSLGSHQAALVLSDGSRLTIDNNADNKYTTSVCEHKRDANGNFILDVNGNSIPLYCNFNSWGYAYITIDTNGARAPNRYGYDTWQLRIWDNRISGCGWSTYTGCLETVLNTGNIVPTSKR